MREFKLNVIVVSNVGSKTLGARDVAEDVGVKLLNLTSLTKQFASAKNSTPTKSRLDFSQIFKSKNISGNLHAFA
jgi:hypothetical protein